jgi:hypothetical protein
MPQLGLSSTDQDLSSYDDLVPDEYMRAILSVLADVADQPPAPSITSVPNPHADVASPKSPSTSRALSSPHQPRYAVSPPHSPPPSPNLHYTAKSGRNAVSVLAHVLLLALIHQDEALASWAMMTLRVAVLEGISCDAQDNRGMLPLHILDQFSGKIKNSGDNENSGVFSALYGAARHLVCHAMQNRCQQTQGAWH